MSVVDRWAVSDPTSAMATRFMGRPDTCTIQRLTAVRTPAGYSQTYATVTTVPCRLGTSVTTVPAESTAAGELVSVTHWMLNVPPNTDLRPSDQVIVQGQRFEVLGGFQAASWNIADTYSLAEITR